MSFATWVPQCDTDGSLYLVTVDPKNLNQHTVVAFKGKQIRTYLPSAISDLHDLHLADFYPTNAEVDFLVRGSKDPPGQPGSGKSPAGIDWSRYYFFISRFDRDGSYKESIQLPISYHLDHFAVFPSGDFLVTGYDQLNSDARLVLLDSSGQIVKTIDLPAARTPVAGDAPFHSVTAEKAAMALMGKILFTPYGQDILVWHQNSNDPILDVNSGGGVREVPLQTPPGFTFVRLIPANDRWVGQFRTQGTPENSRITAATYSYFELRPQDASPSAKLLIPTGLPQSLACEHDGSYITYTVDREGKMHLLQSN